MFIDTAPYSPVCLMVQKIRYILIIVILYHDIELSCIPPSSPERNMQIFADLNKTNFLPVDAFW